VGKGAVPANTPNMITALPSVVAGPQLVDCILLFTMDATPAPGPALVNPAIVHPAHAVPGGIRALYDTCQLVGATGVVTSNDGLITIGAVDVAIVSASIITDLLAIFPERVNVCVFEVAIND
jgi:hypothetical protein